MKTFLEFLRDKKYDIQPSGFATQYSDWQKSLHLALKVLIKCAKTESKISYKGLGIAAEFPENYLRGQAISRISAKVLSIVGEYCEEIKAPRLTALCVNYYSGFPGSGFSYFEPDYDTSNPEDAKKLLLTLFEKISNSDEILDEIVRVNNLNTIIIKDNAEEYIYLEKQSPTFQHFFQASLFHLLALLFHLLFHLPPFPFEEWRYLGQSEIRPTYMIAILFIHQLTTSVGASGWFWLFCIPVAFALFNITTILKLFDKNLKRYVPKAEQE